MQDPDDRLFGDSRNCRRCDEFRPPRKGEKPFAPLSLRPGDGRWRQALCEGGALCDLPREAHALANIVTPNVFELEQLSRRRLDTIDVILEASRALGPRLVTVTGIRNPCPGTVMTAAIERHSAWAASTPELARSAFGTGDLFAALFAARLIDGLPASTALASAVSSLYAVLEVTAPDAADIALITAAERMLRPPRRFEASALQHQKPSLTTDRDMDRQAFRIQE